MGAAIGMDTQELFNDEDLDYTQHHAKGAAGSSTYNHAVSHLLGLGLNVLSARECPQ